MTAQTKQFPTTLVVVGFILIVATAAVITLSTGGDTGLPELSQVPPFELTSQHDQLVHTDQLKGKVWIADLIFTTCSGPCLRMTSQMYRVQEAMADVTDFRMVSISVDPVRDTPERLTWYADMTLADPDKWIFLTGDLNLIKSLAIDGFKLAVANDDHTEPDPNAILHSDRFVLVDQTGRIRGYYAGLEEPDLERLIHDARTLADQGA